MPRICAAFMTEATERVPPGTSVRPGLLHMLQQPSRVVADAPDTAGRGSASAALLAGSSSQRAAGAADVPTARRDAAPACATAAAAPASGAKTFLETAKRSLDKAAYVKVRAGVCVELRCFVLDARASSVSVAAQGVQVPDAELRRPPDRRERDAAV